MKNFRFSRLLAGALCAAAMRLEAQTVPDSAGRFTIYKLQHPVGSETFQISHAGGVRTLTTEWSFRYLGSPVALHDTLITSAAGEPLHFSARGQTSTLTDVDLGVDLSRDSATVNDRGAARTSARPPQAFPTNSYPAAAVEEALFQYWQRAQRPRSLALVPLGAVSFAYRGNDTLDLGFRREVVRRYAVSGILWGTQSMWVSLDDRSVLAVVNGDAELDRFEAVRDGYGAALDQFVRASVRDGITLMAEAARKVKPILQDSYAIVGGRVIDGAGGPAINDATIIVRDGRVAAVGRGADVKISAGVPRYDASGKTIIPGLWDMHVHFEQVEWPAAQLAAGVTTARDVGNESDLAIGLRDAIQTGRMLGPRLLLAGLIDGAPDGLGVHLAGTDAEARTRVREYHDAGYRQIKIYSSVPPGLVSTIADEAHRLGMTVTGHVPSGMNAIQFVEAGADQINHFGYVLSVMQPPVARGQPRPPVDTASEQARSAIAFFKAHGTVIDPTLARSEENAHPRDSLLSAYEPGAAKAPPELLEVLNASGQPSPRGEAAMARLAAALPVVGALRANGIPIVAGTDLVVPGYSIYRELELEVKAGFTPMQAIQAATIVPARVMGLDNEAGSIAAGKRADLVILDADPLSDIRNIRRVRAVVAGGKMFEPAVLWPIAGFSP